MQCCNTAPIGASPDLSWGLMADAGRRLTRFAAVILAVGYIDACRRGSLSDGTRAPAQPADAGADGWDDQQVFVLG
jgi:hypothetical protein